MAVPACSCGDIVEGDVVAGAVVGAGSLIGCNPVAVGSGTFVGAVDVVICCGPKARRWAVSR